MESIYTGTHTLILTTFQNITLFRFFFSVTSMTMTKLQARTPCKWKNLGSTTEPV